MKNFIDGQYPLISVVMPVYNMEPYVSEAIESVLTQSFSNFEFIIINDGSTDKSSEVLHNYKDFRIRIIDFSKNRGCYPARNYGMRLAHGKYICVMDADDICMQNRFEVQYNFMEQHPEIGLIGSAYRYMNDVRPIFREENYEIIKLLLLRYCYLLHPTCMIRRSLVDKFDLYYNEKLIFASDYAWQVKAASLFPVSNVNEVLLLYRRHDNQISNLKYGEQAEFAYQVRIGQLTSLGVKIEDKNKKRIIDFLVHNTISNRENLHFVEQFIDTVLSANQITKYYSSERLAVMLNILLNNCKITN